MKTLTVFSILLLLPVFLLCAGNTVFDEYFTNHTMRIDYHITGDSSSEIISIDKIYSQGIWAGSTKNLIDDLNLGRYYHKVFDAETGKLLYSRGFDSYFGEYRLTTIASKGVERTFHESALIPYPMKKVVFEVHSRDKKHNLHKIFSQKIDPSGVSIIKESLAENVKVFEIEKSGDPHKKVDIAIIAEGYTKNESKKAIADFYKFKDIFFSMEPYKSMKDSFNIYGVYKASEETGCDEPRAGIFRNTAISSTFNSLGSARYLLTEDNKALRDIAAHAPYDALLIMVNHNRYGGGGIYNFFCTFTTDNQWHEYLLLHEFGHSFSGLADEYYTSSTAYNEFYPRGIEPLEPNITALLDPANLKWKDLVTEGIDIPTVWEKPGYDKMDNEYQKIRHEVNDKIANLKRTNAPYEEIRIAEEKSEKLSKKNANRTDQYIQKSKYFGKVGAFEGAGYSSKGLYRSMLDCLMFSKGKKPFCEVCKAAVVKAIKHYTE